MHTLYDLIDKGLIARMHGTVLKQKADALRSGQKLNVCFFVSQKQFWSMQSIYDALLKYDFFNLFVVPFPTTYHTGNELRENYDDVCAFHEQKGATLIHVCDYARNLLVLPEDIAPDIIFYEQHWMGNYHPLYTIGSLSGTALCICMPYGVMIANIPEDQFNGHAHNIAWRNFVETPMHFRLSRKYAYNKGVNTVVSGYPKFDAYTHPVKKNYWKTADPQIKRIIWAPHYSVKTGTKINYATFLLYWEKLFDFVKGGKGRFEMILKPHPALKSQCIRRGMPVDAFDNYMKKWNSLPNASVVTDGDYIDLFATSDAMILDSLSFISEYMITGKPLCFLSKFAEFAALSNEFNDFGKRAIALIDIAYTFKEIVGFVEDVCDGTATVSEERAYFTEETLKFNFGCAGEFIANHIVEQLRFA